MNPAPANEPVIIIKEWSSKGEIRKVATSTAIGDPATIARLPAELKFTDAQQDVIPTGTAEFLLRAKSSESQKNMNKFCNNRLPRKAQLDDGSVIYVTQLCDQDDTRGRRFLSGDLVCKLQAPITQAPITPPPAATFAVPPAPPGVVRGEGAMEWSVGAHRHAATAHDAAGAGSVPGQRSGGMGGMMGGSGMGGGMGGGQGQPQLGGGYGSQGDGFSGRGQGFEPDEAAAPKRRRLDGQIFGAGQCGGAGRPIEVVTNFYGVRVNPLLRVVQYDVKLESGRGEEVKLAETRRHIVGEALLHLLAPPPVTGWAYDGKAILLVANGELTLTDQAAAAGWARTEHGQLVRSPPAIEPGRRGGVRRFGGTLTLTRAGFEGAFVDFERFHSAVGGSAARVQMMVLDVVLRAQSARRCKVLGDAFYDATLERGTRPWAERNRIAGGLCELWLGYRTAVVYTATGPRLQVDRAASCMLASTELHRFIADKLRVTKLELTGHGEHARLSGIPIPTINRKLTEGARNVKASSKHRMSTDDRMPLMNYTVRGLDTCRCDEARFQEVCGACARCQDGTIPRRSPIEERCETPTWTTVAEWFARNFPSFPITRPDWPCVLAGSQTDPGSCKVPLEFLRILPGQPVQETSPEMLQEMIRQTAIKPHVRFPKIDEIVRAEYAPSTQERRLSEDFGIEVDPQSVRTMGRVLQPCTLRYGNQVYQPDHRGSWNLRNVPFKRPAECAGWAMVQCISDEQMRGVEIATFINTLSRVAVERQMRLGPTVGDAPIKAYGTMQPGAAIKAEKFLSDEVARLERESPGHKIGMLLAIISDSAGENGRYVYPALKRWSHTISGIPVQCVQVSKALKVGDKKKMANDPQYAAGLLLKMNLKLGGENCYAISPERVGSREEGLSLMMQVIAMDCDGLRWIAIDRH